ncbi:hypothetical protein [Nitrospirillum viridazoti]|uniref:Uncharacterized protein n=1 Tax=Nitrospirillum amazonense TaxID=28077 RepID=A0A560J0U0_9PROT|nr:hypothetical protein [Nitrospirillum amazonense]TWB62250.1 hypothetical protein FBZ92_105185 [Nitrospirillum amazonense]
MGLSWRSGLRSLGRQNLYLTLMQMVPLLTVPDIHFVVLQYDARAGDAAAEMAEVTAATGVTLRLWEDLDLRDDQEGGAALLAGLDLVVSAGTAVGELSAALGMPTWRFHHMAAWAALRTGASPLMVTAHIRAYFIANSSSGKLFFVAISLHRAADGGCPAGCGSS